MPSGYEKQNRREPAAAQDFSTVSIPRITPEMIDQARSQAASQPGPASPADPRDADRAAAQLLARNNMRRRGARTAGPAHLARPAAFTGDTTTSFPIPEAYGLPAQPGAVPVGDTTTSFPIPEAYGLPAQPDTAPEPAARTETTVAIPPQRRGPAQARVAVPRTAPPRPGADLTVTSAAQPEPAPEQAPPTAAAKAAQPKQRRRTRAQAEAELRQSIHDDHLWLNNPVMVRGLGLAPAVVAVTSAGAAVQLCAAAVLLLTATRVLAVALCHLLGKRQRPLLYAFCGALVYIPAYCLLYRWFGADLTLLGIYLPLLVTDPAVIKRMEAPELETVPEALRRGINNTVGFCAAMLLLGMLRELLGAGTVFGYTVISRALLPLAAQPAGGFLLLGLMAAVWTAAGGAYVHYKQEEVRHLYAEHRH